ncbi:MAG: type II toxin-antitoxin system RelE/ParE family toxin [Deltaproteobacteria bacterium]|nr:type II toxin-antitoxin system RelE/ParE family toxin [Deltaproteobacteria bacterium]
MSSFQLEYYSKAEKDLEKLRDAKEVIVILDQIQRHLEKKPFPYPPLKKRIQGFSWPLFRLRIDTKKESYRVFYIFKELKITILRIVKKKDADKTIRSLRK